jgi:DNA-binding transcriptional regulator YiaG
MDDLGLDPLAIAKQSSLSTGRLTQILSGVLPTQHEIREFTNVLDLDDDEVRCLMSMAGCSDTKEEIVEEDDLPEMTVARFIVCHREAISLKQEALAKKIGCKLEYLQNVERGVLIPPASRSKKIIAALCLSPEDAKTYERLREEG